ncbi:hypothetical protein KSS87_010178 [Heliosperma pusillum]|nr:hypothetical protein KSS87_010178 [Heliosperma pusillum]
MKLSRVLYHYKICLEGSRLFYINLEHT